MSYSIIYDKLFIKLSKDNYIPMLYAGSNNCYETSYRNKGRERRSRDWGSDFYFCGDKKYATKETILENIEKFKQELINNNNENIENYGEKYGKFNDKHFGYYSGIAITGKGTRGTTYGNYLGIYKTGCEQAMTVEEMNLEGISVSMRIYRKNESNSEMKFFNTSSELMEFLDYTSELNNDTSFSIEINASEHRMKWLRRARKKEKPIREKVAKQITEYYIFINQSTGYFVKGTGRGYRYCGYKNSKCKRVYTEKQAKTFCEKLNEKHSGCWEIEKVILEKPETIFI